MSWGKLFSHAYYGGHGKVAMNIPWWTNARHNISRDPPEKRLFSGAMDSSRKKMLLRLELQTVE